MLIIDSFEYSAQGLPNNRCSRHRSMTFTHDITCEVAELSDAEAPLLVEIGRAERDYGEDGKRTRRSITWHPYRVHGGSVWVPTETVVADIPARISQHLINRISWGDRQPQAVAKFQAALENFVAERRIIDGRLWEPGEEPAIVLQSCHYRDTFLYLQVVDSAHEVGKADDGLAFRLDELAVAVREVQQRHRRRDQDRKVDTADVLIRNLRADLLTRPSYTDYLARVAWHGLAAEVVRNRGDLGRIRAAADELAAHLVTTRPPSGCDPNRITTLIRLLAEIAPILDDPAMDERAGRDPQDDEQHQIDLANQRQVDGERAVA